METNKKIFYLLTASVFTFLLTSCQILQEPFEIILKTDPAEQRSNTMSKRFRDVAPEGQTAVDSAIKLAQEHTKLSDKIVMLQQNNQELIADNRRLKDRIAALEPELKQAKKELAEANDLLIEMRIELNNWKTDILGYRGEMRDAYTAQMEILLKIAQAMGAEITPEQEENKQSTETLISGEPNE